MRNLTLGEWAIVTAVLAFVVALSAALILLLVRGAIETWRDIARRQAEATSPDRVSPSSVAREILRGTASFIVVLVVIAVVLLVVLAGVGVVARLILGHTIEVVVLAAAIAIFLAVLYGLVRFVKWAWTDRPAESQTRTSRAETRALVDKLSDRRMPLSKEEWSRVVDLVTFHTSDGRTICRKCGVPIPEGRGVLLADDEASRLPGGLGGFKHADMAECGASQR